MDMTKIQYVTLTSNGVKVQGTLQGCRKQDDTMDRFWEIALKRDTNGYS